MFDTKGKCTKLLLSALVGILLSWVPPSAYSQAVFLKFDHEMPAELSELLQNSFARLAHVVFVRIEDESNCDAFKFCDGLLVNLKLKPLRPQAICLAERNLRRLFAISMLVPGDR